MEIKSHQVVLHGRDWKAFSVVWMSLALVFAWVLGKVNTQVSEAYMDEIFHFPQTQKYCLGDFASWDNKITTFPGLYVAGMMYSHVVAWMTSFEWNKPATFCSLSNLRSLNVWFFMGNLLLLYKLRRLTNPIDSSAALHAFMIAMFPIHVFFSFLYYTDNGATYFVLLMYLLAENQLKKQQQQPNSLPAGSNFVLSALSGAVAVFFRQTNILWVLFVTGIVIVRTLEFFHGNFIYGYPEDTRMPKSAGAWMPQTSSIQVLWNFILLVVGNFVSIVKLVWPFGLVVLSFVAFLVINGSVVVGDKSNHAASAHFAQLFYCLTVVSSGFSIALVNWKQWKAFADDVRRKASSGQGVLLLVGIVVVCVVMIHVGSPVHQFLLADNRHYTFYIWRKFFRKHALAKFVPLMLYYLAAWKCYRELRKNCSPLWIFIFFLAVFLALVPSPLVEPRYYLVPFIIFHVNTATQPRLQHLCTIFVYGVVNVVTLYIFLFKPFTWVDNSIARFLW